jgi:hypothetical protein
MGGVGSVSGVEKVLALGISARVAHAVLSVEAEAPRPYRVFTTRAAQAAGVGPATIEVLCRHGRWFRPCYGVLGVRGVRSKLQQTAAELLAAGAGAYATNLTAAAVHGGLDLDRLPLVPELAVSSKSSRRPRRSDPPRHIVAVKGLRCMDGLLTLLALALCHQ